MRYHHTNIFLQIIEKKIPCKTIFEDNTVTAFYDISPKSKVHIIIIPRHKYISFQDFIKQSPPKYVHNFFYQVGIIINFLGIIKKGYRIITNHSYWGNQEISHFHIHILSG
jgi:histidine triad (HIT) family protein